LSGIHKQHNYHSGRSFILHGTLWICYFLAITSRRQHRREA
jgi:hypothetical protein